MIFGKKTEDLVYPFTAICQNQIFRKPCHNGVIEIIICILLEKINKIQFGLLKAYCCTDNFNL